MKRLLLAAGLLLAGCDRTPAGGPTPGPKPEPPKREDPVELDPQVLGNFEYKEKMELPKDVAAWNGRRVKITGFINPTQQAVGLTNFLLVKDRSSCCFGKRPQINHYIEVTLADGKKMNYTQDPVGVVGTLKIEDRWDGDWQLGLYWIDDGEIATH